LTTSSSGGVTSERFGSGNAPTPQIYIAMKTLFSILFFPIRVAWKAFIFLLKLILIFLTFGMITMMDS
jgi:hypothetical protein